MEQYLITLYMKAFEEAPTVSSQSVPIEETPKAKATIERGSDAMLHYSCLPIAIGGMAPWRIPLRPHAQ